MIQIYLINMEKDVERLAHITAQLNNIDLTAKRINAVNGKLLPDEEFDFYNQARINGSNKNWGRGNLGCFLSHRLTWETFNASQENYCLVIEDDVFLSPDLKLFLASDVWIPKDADIVRLETSTNRLRLGKCTSLHHREIAKVLSTSWCAGAYLIKKEYAKKLIALPPEKWSTVDALMFEFETSEIARNTSIYQINPALTEQAKFNIEHSALSNFFFSNIEQPQQTKKPWQKLKEFLKRLKRSSFLLKTVMGYKRIYFKK
jgi:glycosyl transferase family 25